MRLLQLAFSKYGGTKERVNFKLGNPLSWQKITQLDERFLPLLPPHFEKANAVGTCEVL